jgi:hypothetical protein
MEYILRIISVSSFAFIESKYITTPTFLLYDISSHRLSMASFDRISAAISCDDCQGRTVVVKKDVFRYALNSNNAI